MFNFVDYLVRKTPEELLKGKKGQLRNAIAYIYSKWVEEPLTAVLLHSSDTVGERIGNKYRLAEDIYDKQHIDIFIENSYNNAQYYMDVKILSKDYKYIKDAGTLYSNDKKLSGYTVLKVSKSVYNNINPKSLISFIYDDSIYVVYGADMLNNYTFIEAPNKNRYERGTKQYTYIYPFEKLKEIAMYDNSKSLVYSYKIPTDLVNVINELHTVYEKYNKTFTVETKKIRADKHIHKNDVDTEIHNATIRLSHMMYDELMPLCQELTNRMNKLSQKNEQNNVKVDVSIINTKQNIDNLLSEINIF